MSEWTVYITNDNCPDYTWGLTEERTRQSFADIVAAHLDLMTRTDAEAPENQDRYNMAVTQEALCFVERYPGRKEELIRRIKEGRVFVSPYLCNTLWAFQSFEGAIRSFYPARRLEREWGIPMTVAEHIEEPSLPWGMASLLAGCGLRWLSNPFYSYDSTFGNLENPPLFLFEGPDGGRVRVVMDPWACHRAHYGQGAWLLADPGRIAGEWVEHYRQFAPAYPLRHALASGTHDDISPRSGEQAPGFAEAIKRYNESPQPHPRLVNAALPQFCEAVDAAEARHPFLPVVRGCFGHSWDVWPVSLAKHAADMRANDRDFLAAEALLAVASLGRPDLREATQADRERAEWLWAMLGDHAWNGTDDQNKRHNADLRRRWNEELAQINRRLVGRGWEALGLAANEQALTLFNSLSFPRQGLVCVEARPGLGGAADGARHVPAQVVREDDSDLLCFISPPVEGFGLRPLRLTATPPAAPGAPRLRASPTELESPYYRLTVDPLTGGVKSLVHKPSGAELVDQAAGRTLCQTVYSRGAEHVMRGASTEVAADGPVLARLCVRGTVGDVEVTNLITVYADLDQVDFDLRVCKPVTTEEERLCQVFPLLGPDAVLRIETPGAVIRPRPQPEGDLLPGADPRRFAVQGFVDICDDRGIGVTIAPLDSFVLRLDLDRISFEALGNDQNYREVSRDQDGVTSFRFRYALRAYSGGYRQAGSVAWSRAAATPLLRALGLAPEGEAPRPPVVVDARRAIATCLKPADDEAGGIVLRLWETAGEPEPVSLGLPGCRQAVRTDLLERDLEKLGIREGRAELPLPAHGFGAVRLLP